MCKKLAEIEYVASLDHKSMGPWRWLTMWSCGVGSVWFSWTHFMLNWSRNFLRGMRRKQGYYQGSQHSVQEASESPPVVRMHDFLHRGIAPLKPLSACAVHLWVTQGVWLQRCTAYVQTLLMHSSTTPLEGVAPASHCLECSECSSGTMGICPSLSRTIPRRKEEQKFGFTKLVRKLFHTGSGSFSNVCMKLL